MISRCILAAPQSPAKRLLFATAGVLLCLSALAQTVTIQTTKLPLTTNSVWGTWASSNFPSSQAFRIGAPGQLSNGTVFVETIVIPAPTNSFATVTFNSNTLYVVGPLATTNDSTRWAASSKTNFTMGLKIQ